jgi:RecA/RadA recombinase
VAKAKPIKGKMKVAKPQASAPAVSKADRIALLRDKVNKRFKADVVSAASEATTTSFIRRPIGIPSLDRWIAGGLQAGSITQFIGKPSSCKSYALDRLIAQNQDTYGEQSAVYMAMTEQKYDKLKAKKTGVRISMSSEEIEQVEAAYGRELTDEEREVAQEQVGHFEEAAGSAEQVLEAVIAAVASNEFQIVGVDSIAALLPNRELEAEDGLEQQFRGGQTQLLGAFQRQLHMALNTRDSRGKPNCTSVVLINQWRDNMNAGPYGNPLKQSGGYAIQHGLGLNILFEQGATLYFDKAKKDFRVVGREINWKILKAKTGCHDGPKGMFQFYFGDFDTTYGVDDVHDLYVAAREQEIIAVAGAWYTAIDDEGEVRLKANGEEKFVEALRADDDLQVALRSMIFSRAGISFVTREPWLEGLTFPDVSDE